MARPTFSVIVPAYNRRHTIERAIDSILAQTCPPGEIIVVDDGSHDGLAAFVTRRFPQVRLFRLETNRGAARARNFAIERAANNHLAFLDSDDAWHEDYLAAMGDAWHRHPEASLVYAPYEKIEDRPNGRVEPIDVSVGDDQIEAMLRNNFIHSCSLMSTRRDWALEAGGFDPAFRICEDRALYLQLLLRGPAVQVDRRLVRRYVGEDNLIHDLDRWWRDANETVARFVAKPEFAAYRWVEDESRPRLWTIINWHRRQRERARARSGNGDKAARRKPVRARPEPASKRDDEPAVYLFVHAGGLPEAAIAAQLDAARVFGLVGAWFDHDDAMLEIAVAGGMAGFDEYLNALLADAGDADQPLSALVSFRDLAWLGNKRAFRTILRRPACRLIRLRMRDKLLQASRRLGRPEDGAHAFDAMAKSLVNLEQAETFGDRWLARERLCASTLWLEDLAAPHAPGLVSLLSYLGLPHIDGDLPALDPPAEEELNAVRQFRAEASRRQWSHACSVASASA